MGGRGVEFAQHQGHGVALAVMRHARHAHGGVVGPDRTVVVGHGIEARLTAGQGAQAPACSEPGGQQPFGHPPGPLRRGQAAEQQMSGVGAQHPARAPRRRPRRWRRIPRSSIQKRSSTSARRRSARSLQRRRVASPQQRRQLGQRPPGGIGVALHLQQGDRPLPERRRRRGRWSPRCPSSPDWTGRCPRRGRSRSGRRRWSPRDRVIHPAAARRLGQILRMKARSPVRRA